MRSRNTVPSLEHMLTNVYLASGFSAMLRYAFKEHILSMCRYVHGRSVKGLLPRGEVGQV